MTWQVLSLNGLRLGNLFNRRCQFHDTALSTMVYPDAFSYRESAGGPPPDPTSTMSRPHLGAPEPAAATRKLT